MSARKLRDRDYQRFVRSHPCVVAVAVGHARFCKFGVEACHFHHSGMGGKDVPDRGNLWPGCRVHHDMDHNGRETFQRQYHLDLLGVCVRLLDEFLNGANFINGPYGAEVAHL